MLVAPELLEEADLLPVVPTEKGEPVEGLGGAVLHGGAEVPGYDGLVLSMEKGPDVPLHHGAPGVPLGEPPLDICPAVVLWPQLSM